MKLVVCLGGGWQQLESIIAIKKNGFYVVVIDGNGDCIAKGVADFLINIDVKDFNAIYNELKSRFILGNVVDVLAINNDVGQYSVSIIKSKIFGENQKEDLLKDVCNKSILRKSLDELPGFNQPKYLILESGEGITNELISRISQRSVVIKPVDSSGSRGVSICNVAGNLRKIHEAIKLAKKFSKSNKVLIEQFILGVEYSVEAINTYQHGLNIACISIRHMHGEQSAKAIETILYDSDKFKLIEAFAKKFVTAINHKQGLLHIELIVDDDKKIYPIDVGFRGGGYWVSDRLASSSLGMNINLLNLLNNIALPPFINVVDKRRKMLVFNRLNDNRKIQLDGYKLVDKIILTPSEDSLFSMADTSRTSIEYYVEE